MLPKPPSSSKSHLNFYRIKTLNFSNFSLTVKHLVKNGRFDDALHFYHLLRASNVDPINLPIVHALKTCVKLPAFHEALSIHTFVTKSGLLNKNLIITNSLIEMYSGFFHMDLARKIFDEMPHRNIVSWNLMILGYNTSAQPTSALNFCILMKDSGVAMDSVGFKIVLPICGKLNAVTLGESVHGHLLVTGASNDTAIATAIMNMYAKCGELDLAERSFEEILRKDVVSWNAMIAGYLQAKKYRHLFYLLNEMLLRGFNPSRPTILLSLQACAQLSSLNTGMAVHGRVVRNGFSDDVSIKGLLIDMYSKCGQQSYACRVFMEVTEAIGV